MGDNLLSAKTGSQITGPRIDSIWRLFMDRLGRGIEVGMRLPRKRQENRPYPKPGLAGSPQRRAWLRAQRMARADVMYPRNI